MDPADFLSVAIKLSASQREADLRTAVGRAYYGAFHFVRQFLHDCGVQPSRKDHYGAEIHKKVRFCLDAAGSSYAALASENLATLRDHRNDADYDLESTDFRNAAYVKTMVRAAAEIVDSLQRCRAEPTFSETRDEIRTYARDVLRLTVTDS